MTDRARAAVLTEFGKPLEIQEFPILDPEPGGLVVAVEAATVCGTDVHNWQGHTSSLKPPVVPGHEGVGRIIAFGDHAEADSRGTPLALGDRVVWGHANCGTCHACTMLQDETLCADRFIGMLTPCIRPPYLHGTFAGSTRAFGEGVEMAAPKARYVMAGAVGGMPQPVPVPLLIKRNLTVIGSLGAAIGAYADALEFIERFDDRFTWDRLLGPGRYSLEDATLALQRTSDLEETKAVILPGRIG
jgi:D-arabinose 1-dehydrogenase-like Zn-dependent alcohol dehydrogenase